VIVGDLARVLPHGLPLAVDEGAHVDRMGDLLLGGTELAPADAQVAVEDERGVGLTVTDSAFLLRSMVAPSFVPLRMERHAPAAAPHTVVPLHETREVGPRLLVQWLDDVAGHRRKGCRELPDPVIGIGADLPLLASG
jgi:hypothetical protein